MDIAGILPPSPQPSRHCIVSQVYGEVVPNVPNSDPNALLRRLRRAHGHLRAVIRMMEEGRGVRELAQQLDAIAAALAKARHQVLEDVLAHDADLRRRGAPGLSRHQRAALLRLL